MAVGRGEVQVVATVCFEIRLAEGDGVAQRFPGARGQVMPIVRFTVVGAVRVKSQAEGAGELLLEGLDLCVRRWCRAKDGNCFTECLGG